MIFLLQQWLQKSAPPRNLKYMYVTTTFKFYGKGILDLEFYFIFPYNFRAEHFSPQSKNIMRMCYGCVPQLQHI